MSIEAIPASFRDPSGFVYKRDGLLLRQVNELYRSQYDKLMNSGLYARLVDAHLLIPHEEVDSPAGETPGAAYRTLKPRMVPFISYPWEWSFSQLKDAALTTLEVQKSSLEHGMTLKDCSAFNVQFLDGRPVFIDTLSFDEYAEGAPWPPYRQFCQHFLAPLALMSLVDVRLNQLLRVYIDGVPLDLASALLAGRARFSLGLGLHIRAHAKSQRRYEDRPEGKSAGARPFSKTSLLGLLDSLEGTVRKLQWKPEGTQWADYYSDDSYTEGGLKHKQELVQGYLRQALPAGGHNGTSDPDMPVVWDLGANTGLHSRLACDAGALTIAFDQDPACVEINYLEAVKNRQTNILPLLMDLTNPTSPSGWAGEERSSMNERGPADTAMALALIHHLAISNNVPLPMVASFFAGLCRNLIVEFVPKSDHKVQKLLATREDIFPDYTQEGFERAFGKLFEIRASQQIRDSGRVLYLMMRK